MRTIGGCCLLLACATMRLPGLALQATPDAPPAPPAQQSIVLENPPTPEQVGDALMNHQRFQAAIAAYQKAPVKTAPLWNKMGIAYQMLFDINDAVRCYRASLKLDGKDARVYNNLGAAYDSAKEYGPAEKSYRHAIKLDPQFALAWKNLGSELMMAHKYRPGAAAYKRALEIDPQIFQDKSGLRVTNQASAKDRGAMNYYMARGCARSGQVECALLYLRQSINEGYATPKLMTEEPDFAALRELPAFQQLLLPGKR